MITPEAEIMHLVGASSGRVADKVMMVAKSRTTLIRDHWPGACAVRGCLMWLWGALRVMAADGRAQRRRGPRERPTNGPPSGRHATTGWRDTDR